MLRKISLLVLIFTIAWSANAQKSINDYKYVVVPINFEFLKGNDTYRTSTLLRYLFKKEGFEVYYNNEELPEELFKDRCVALYSNVIRVSSFLKTKVQIQLNDCYGNEVYLSKEGSTKIKEYNKAYPVAIRQAFKSIELLEYEYNPKSDIVSSKQDDTNVEDDIKKKESEAKALNEAEKELLELRKEVDALKNQKDSIRQTANNDVIKVIEVPKVKDKAEVAKDKLQSDMPKDLLYAQAIDNGFQLIDNTPKVVMVLLKTAAPNVYTVKGKEAIVFKEGDNWVYSENGDKKELNIKF